MGSGKKEVARELGMKSREHDSLAGEARARANGAAYDGFNRKLLNRWKVHHLCARWPSVFTVAACQVFMSCSGGP